VMVDGVENGGEVGDNRNGTNDLDADGGRCC